MTTEPATPQSQKLLRELEEHKNHGAGQHQNILHDGRPAVGSTLPAQRIEEDGDQGVQSSHSGTEVHHLNGDPEDGIRELE